MFISLRTTKSLTQSTNFFFRKDHNPQTYSCPAHKQLGQVAEERKQNSRTEKSTPLL